MLRRIGCLILRNLYLYRRSLARAGEIFFWPVMDLLLWGFLTVYLEAMHVPHGVSFLLGGAIFWDVLYRSQQAITLAMTEEIWVRNILNLFLAPVRTAEIVVANCLVGLLRAGVTAVVLGLLAWRRLLRLDAPAGKGEGVSDAGGDGVEACAASHTLAHA